jgi:hypothetical protein
MAIGVAPALLPSTSLTIGPWGERRRVRVTGCSPLTAICCSVFPGLPLAIDHHLVGVGRVGLFGDQVDVIVLEHGQAPAEVTVVASRANGLSAWK